MNGERNMKNDYQSNENFQSKNRIFIKPKQCPCPRCKSPVLSEGYTFHKDIDNQIRKSYNFCVYCGCNVEFLVTKESIDITEVNLAYRPVLATLDKLLSQGCDCTGLRGSTDLWLRRNSDY